MIEILGREADKELVNAGMREDSEVGGILE